MSNLLKTSLLEYYSKKKNMEFLYQNLVNSSISLRNIEWFCNNYSKRKCIVYKVNGKDFNVYNSYNAHLDSYQKKLFDPCKRKYKNFPPFDITYNGKVIQTTLCQLNYFKWLNEYNIMDYIKEHIKEIKEDLKMFDKSKKTNAKLGVIPNKMFTDTYVRYHSKVSLVFD